MSTPPTEPMACFAVAGVLALLLFCLLSLVIRVLTWLALLVFGGV